MEKANNNNDESVLNTQEGNYKGSESSLVINKEEISNEISKNQINNIIDCKPQGDVEVLNDDSEIEIEKGASIIEEYI